MAYPATVSDFLLDRYEVTVGRFRRFVEAYPGSRPRSGAGAHPRIPSSGWDPRGEGWDANLPEDQAALKEAVKCSAGDHTWTDELVSEERDRRPMNCLSWYAAFAFCAWDGGRLPTEAEWNYAAAGGNEQREYPWSNPPSSTTTDGSYAVYDCTGDGSGAGDCTFQDILNVGSRSPRGDGRWRQVDLAGSVWEWVLDWSGGYLVSCNDCAKLVFGSRRVVRGGGWYGSASSLLSSTRYSYAPADRDSSLGVRCARTP
jgi:formylglycine-generating enzyme required for sulfatase activity